MTELLTRLNAKVQSFSDSGGRSELLPADIAGALAGNNPLGVEAMLVRHGWSQKRLHGLIYAEIRRKAAKYGWRLREGDKKRLERLSSLVLAEKVSPMKCPACNGTKNNPFNPAKLCLPCAGSGEFRLEDWQRAEILGISKQAYSKTWKARFETICLTLEYSERDAKHGFIARLTERTI